MGIEQYRTIGRDGSRTMRERVLWFTCLCAFLLPSRGVLPAAGSRKLSVMTDTSHEIGRFYKNQPDPANGTSVYFNGTGTTWAMLNNVCWGGGTKIMLLRKPESPRVMPKNWRPQRPEKYNGFGWAWNWIDQPVPDPEAHMKAPEATYVPRNHEPNQKMPLHGDGTWLSAGPFEGHLAHFVEGHMGYLHSALNPSDYPPVRSIVGANFGFNYMQNLGIMWKFITGPLLKHSLDVVRNRTAPREETVVPDPPSFVMPWGGSQSESFRRLVMPKGKNRVCFERLYMMGRSMSPTEGGVFSDFEDADIFRDAAYKHFNVRLLPPPTRALRAMIIRRRQKSSHGRVFKNEHTIEKVFNRLGFDVQYIDHPEFGRFEQVSLATGVEWLANTDIFVGAHGSGLANCIFMQKGSGVLEVFPRDFHQIAFQGFAGSSNLEYEGLHGAPGNAQEAKRGAAKGRVNGCDYGKYTDWFSMHGKPTPKCRGSAVNKPITIDEDELEVALRRLVMRVVMRKYGPAHPHATELFKPFYGLGLEEAGKQALRSCCEKPNPAFADLPKLSYE